jgi:hypothetical protein
LSNSYFAARNKLFAWGYGHFGNANGYVGTSVKISNPVLLRWQTSVLPDEGTFDDIALSAEGDFAILLSTTVSAFGNRVFAFGQNNLGQTGTGSAAAYVLTPTPVVGVVKTVASVYAGKDYGVLLYSALTPETHFFRRVSIPLSLFAADGTIGTFGSNEFGQLAIGNLSIPFSNVVLLPDLDPLRINKTPIGSYSVAACSQDQIYHGYIRNCVLHCISPRPLTDFLPKVGVETMWAKSSPMRILPTSPVP